MAMDGASERKKLRERARGFVERGDRTAAIATLEQALSSAQDRDPELDGELARLCLQERRLDKAEIAIKRVLAVVPSDPAALRLLGRIHDLRGDYEKSAEVYSSALSAQPDDPELWRLTGIAERRAGRPRDALASLGRCLDADPAQPFAHYHRALALKALGRREAAREALYAASTLRPADVYVRAALDSLDSAATTFPDGRLRIGLHMNKPFHEALLRPLFDRLRAEHPVLLTADAVELCEFAPDIVVVCDSQPRTLRPTLPDARFVYIRHGMISKNHGLTIGRFADYVCASGPAMRDQFVAAGIAAERIWITGFVQTDPLFAPESAALPIDLAAGARCVLFAPTYNPSLSAAPLVGPDVRRRICGTRGDVVLVIKPHPTSFERSPDWIDGWRKSAADDPRIHLVDDPAADAAPWLRLADVLVSDVSSVAFQFLALDRPIVLVTNPAATGDTSHYDPDGIEWRWRDMADEVHDTDTLADAVARALDGEDRFAERRAGYRERLFGTLTDGRSAERIVERIDALGAIPS